jgi:hypothetical protein
MCTTADVIPWQEDRRFDTIGKIEPNPPSA